MKSELTDKKKSNVTSADFHAGPVFNEVLEALTGFEFKMLRTFRDLILSPIKVGKKALTGDHGVYLGQLRLFVMLIGLQSLIFSLTQFYENISVQTLYVSAPQVMDAYGNFLAENGHSIGSVNSLLQDWVNLISAPFNALAALLFGGLFKLFDRRYTYFGHVLLFVTLSNAVTILLMPFIFLTKFGPFGLTAYTAISFIILTTMIGLFIWNFYCKSTWNGIWKIAISIIFSLFTMAFIGILTWIILNFVIDQAAGKGPITFMFQNLEMMRPPTELDPSQIPTE